MRMDRTIGDWQRISNLGEGGFGVVSLWMNQSSKETIAIKQCKKLKVSDKERERWCREVEIVKSIKHPNIVSHKALPAELETGIKSLSNLPLLSMEYCRRGNLRFVLQRPYNSSGLQEVDVRSVLGDMTEALLYLHQLHVVHRDFKPENIVLQASTDRKDGLIYKLIDLGFAKELDNTLSIVGTTDYVAPEILCGQRYNVGVDYWSFGIVAYEIICGNHKYPFPSNVPFAERIKHLKNKKHNHISILYQNSTGVTYSSRITQKCHLSSWLKEQIEAWLQLPLELDGNKRCRPNPLQELKVLLKTKVLTVFSMYTLQFYYYEINECILISTLKTWIKRDTKIETANQLILANDKILDLPSDEELLINVLPEAHATVYVFNKCCLWSPIAKLPSPDFLPDDLDAVDTFTALSSSVYYCVLSELKHFSAVAGSISLLNEYNEWLFRETFRQHGRLYLTFYNMVILIEFFNSTRKEISTKRTSCNSFEKQTEKDLLCLTSCVKKISTKMDKLELRIAQLKRCEQIIIKDKSKNLNARLSHHLAELQRNINGVEGKIKSADKSNARKIAFGIVSETIKRRQETLRYLKSEAKIQAYVMEEIPKVTEWISGLQENVNKTISSLHTLQSQGYELLSKEADLMTVQSAKPENSVLDYKKLIKDNKHTRLQLEESIIRGLSRFRLQCEVTENFLHSIPK